MDSIMPSQIATRLRRLRDHLDLRGESKGSENESAVKGDAQDSENAFCQWEQWSQFRQQQ
jgi:hypothetical protein